MTQAAAAEVGIEPILGYPSQAETGKRYLFTVDLRPLDVYDNWPYPTEECIVHCIVDGAPLFTCQPLGDPAVVVHRFGGSYGPARFLLTAESLPRSGTIRVTLVNRQGMPLTVLETPTIEVRTSRISMPPVPFLGPAEPVPELLGATPVPGGTTFRVWAPNAESVHVAGTFNDWSRSAHPLRPDADGCWGAEVPGARAGDEYKYVVRREGRDLWKIDPRARRVTYSAGNAVVEADTFDWGDDRSPAGSRRGLVLYEVHPATFSPAHTGVPGTLDDVAERLPYLRDLGITALQLMPVMSFPHAFSWGYNPSNPFAVAEVYGGPDALRRLVKDAHREQIAVIATGVYDHFGPGDLEHSLWQFDGWSANGGGGIYFYNDTRADTPWGRTRPDYSRPEVRRFITDNVLMWLQEYRLDGVHWSSTHFIREMRGAAGKSRDHLPDGWVLMREVNAAVRGRFPRAVRSAEDVGYAPITQVPDNGGAGFEMQWDEEFARAVRGVLSPQYDTARDMYALRRAIEPPPGIAPFARVVYTESHDMVANGRSRVPEEIWPGNAASWYSRKRSTLGAGLVFTAPGIPMIFQGQELLSDGWFVDSAPVRWELLEAHPGIHLLYRDLIRLRRNEGGTTRGLRGSEVRVHHVNDYDKVIAFHRWHRGGPLDDVVVVVNCGYLPWDDYVVGLPRAGTWRVRLNSDWSGYGSDYGDHPTYDVVAAPSPRDGYDFQAPLSIGPYTILILSQDE